MIAHPAPAVPRARRRLPHPTLVWAIAAAWAVAVAAQVTGRGQALHHDGLLQGGLASWAALGLFLLAWRLMIAAMMLPSSLPHPSGRRPGQRQPPTRPLRARRRTCRLRRAVDRLRGRRLPRRPGHPPPGRPLELAGHRPALLGGAVLLLVGSVPVLDAEGPLPAGVRHPGGYLLRHYRRGTGARRFGWRATRMFCAAAAGP